MLEEGSANTHVAIVARTLETPLVGQAEGIVNEVESSDFVIIDGENAQVFLRPAEEVRDQVNRSPKARVVEKACFATNRDNPCMTRDNTRVSLLLNADLLIDMPQIEATGADGIGLYRTGIPFMNSQGFPDVDAQYDLYQRILSAANDRPATFRPSTSAGISGCNPSVRARGDLSMGWRSLRILLDRPAILHKQLRALIRAAAGSDLEIMLPMVADIREFDRAKHIVELEFVRASSRAQIPPTALRLGAMIEIPALI